MSATERILLELKLAGHINRILGVFSSEDPAEGMFILLFSDLVSIKRYKVSAASGDNVLNISYHEDNKRINTKNIVPDNQTAFYVGEVISGEMILKFLKMFHEVKMSGTSLIVGDVLSLDDFLIASPLQKQNDDNLNKLYFLASGIIKANPVKYPEIVFEEEYSSNITDEQILNLQKEGILSKDYNPSIPDMVFEKRSETVLPLSWVNFLLGLALGFAITLLIFVKFGSKSEIDQKQNEWIENLMDVVLLHDSTINQLDSLVKQNRDAVIFGDSVRKSMEDDLLILDSPKYTIEDSIRGIKVSEYKTDYYDTIPTYRIGRKTIKVSTTHVLPKRREEWK